MENIMNIEAQDARVNVTFGGSNADLPDPVSFDLPDAQVKSMVTEAIQQGFPGMEASQSVNLTDYVVDRFEATEARPWRLLSLRPKTPFGA
jgi:hypothetical protein